MNPQGLTPESHPVTALTDRSPRRRHTTNNMINQETSHTFGKGFIVISSSVLMWVEIWVKGTSPPRQIVKGKIGLATGEGEQKPQTCRLESLSFASLDFYRLIAPRIRNSNCAVAANNTLLLDH